MSNDWFLAIFMEDVIFNGRIIIEIELCTILSALNAKANLKSYKSYQKLLLVGTPPLLSKEVKKLQKTI